MSTSEENGPEDGHSVPQNFIKTIIDQDLESGKHDRIVTRFPPEPNGYLHIGHAKSICLNFGLALEYQGRCHLRYDDTNPLKESTEYVEAIQRDIQWLGFDWGEHLYFASDYFERMYAYAVQLITQGKAYVDSQDVETIREQRGELGEPGTPSPHRQRTVEENLDLFERMRAGEFADGEHVLRAHIDMSSPNMLMRDPILYRIRHAHHHRTGDEWCIYPMYDFAHCLEDSIEDITHSLCTLEFENNRELYDWLLDELAVECHPQQIEFARLKLDYTVMSKRKLLHLIEEGKVSGWDDPRMPTLSGLRRRGVAPEAIRAFAEMVGVARANSWVDLGKLDYCIRDDLNHEAPRVMGVLDPLKVTITNYPEDEVEWLDADHWPRDIPKEATRKIPFTRELYIERDDFMAEPTRKFYRLAPGREVRLRYGYYVRCEEVVRDDDGHVVELRCTYDPQTRGGATPPDGRKVRGTIHWVSATESIRAELRLYDRLFRVPRPEADPEVPYTENLNPDSLIVKRAHIEPSLAELGPGEHVQFERQGYFFTDPVDHRAADGERVFNQVVPLKDSWAKLQARKKAEAEAERAAESKKTSEPEPAEPQPQKPPTEERDQLRADDPELAARYARYQDELELADDDADILSGDRALADFFEAAVAVHDQPQSVANWIVNELMRETKDTPLAELPFGPEAIGHLVRLLDEGTLSTPAAKEVFEILLERGGDPAQIVEERGLTRIADPDRVRDLVDEVLAANTPQVQAFRGGKTQLMGYFIGQVMQASRGKADPQLTRQVLAQALQAPAEEE